MTGTLRIALALLVSLLAGCGASSNTGSSASASSPTSKLAPLGKRTKTSGCVAPLPLPDLACTPGAAIPGVTTSQICTPGYSKGVRRVSSSTKRRVFLEYGIRSHGRFQYEVDHLVSLEVGGSNGIANLWPEPATPKPGFHEKDQVENYLHAEICAGRLSLDTAQREEAHNWVAIYRKVHKSG